MSMDVFIRSSRSTDETNRVLKKIRAENPDYFDFDFLICEAMDPGPQKDRILKEHGIYGFNVRSLFLVNINDKMRLGKIPQAIEIIRKYFEQDELVVLWENEEIFDEKEF